MADYQKSIQEWLTTGNEGQMYTYFAIPFGDVPSQAPYLVWFASWSLTAPIVEDGAYPPLVIGVVKGGDLPSDATFLARTERKDPTGPPPPPGAPGTTMADVAHSLQDRG